MPADSAPPPQEALASDQALSVAWQEVEANWHDDQAHRRFIALCAMQGALATAGKHYREVRDADPARSEVARRQIEQVMATALASMDLAREPRPKTRSRLLWIGYGLSAFFVLYTLLAMWRGRPP